MDDKALLKESFRDAFLSEKELETVLSGYKKVYVKKNEFILNSGEISNAYYLVEEGFLRSFVIDYNEYQVRNR